MKFNKNWLQEWVDVSDLSAQQLADTLTMAGLEVDAVTPVAPAFGGVVIGEIVAIEPHPDADKLRVCQVAGHPDGLQQVVCGAPNARLGIKIPFATIGAVLPGDFKIKKAKLRGVESNGMLCSDTELGLSDDNAGLRELPLDAPVGADFREWLGLDDSVIEVDLTPNRGDCLGIRGLAREVSALTGKALDDMAIAALAANIEQTLDIDLNAPDYCARYLGRVIRNIDTSRTLPIAMLEKLRRAGMRSHDPIVDITNYVLLELGHPLHAFDLAALEGGIRVRLAEEGETLALLNGQQAVLQSNTLVIADQSKALAIAGIMGGSESAVSATTRDIFLESAWFNPVQLAGRARQYGLHTDASHRYERGVDFSLQRDAIERATRLIVDCLGAEVGPVVEVQSESHLPVRHPVQLTRTKLDQYLGSRLPEEEVTAIFTSLGFAPVFDGSQWTVTPPAARFDIAIAEDLIEEVARVYGYNQLPTRSIRADLELQPVPETAISFETAASVLVARGYREVISYTFISPELQARFSPQEPSIALQNPISSDMSDMRASLLPSLVATLQSNLNRQQTRLRLFESGLRFRLIDGQIVQQPTVAGLLYGSRHAESWTGSGERVDFYDAKGDVEAIFARAGRLTEVSFHATQHPALHPGQTAAIQVAGETVGIVGALHPELQRELDIPNSVLLFEIDRTALLASQQPHFAPLSRFPEVRRDIALVCPRELPAASLEHTVRTAAGECLQNLTLFDVYCGEHIDSSKKSIALGLTFRHASRTLNESEIVAWVDAVLAAVMNEHQAVLR